MSPNKRIFLNIVATYGRSLFALVLGLFTARWVLEALGVSQTELAKRMQVSRPYITKVLHQDVNITFRTAAKLATALKMDFFPDLRPQEVTQKLPNMV